MEKSELFLKFRQIGRAIANLENDYSIESSSPEFCIQLLNYPNLKFFNKLNRKLRNSNKDWINEFIQSKGLFQLLYCVEYLCHKKTGSSLINSILISKCLNCIKEILNHKFGMECIIDMANEDQSFVHILVKAVLDQNQVVKKEIFQIFSAIAMYSESGYTLCLNILEMIKSEKGTSHRFSFFIDEIKNNVTSGSYLSVIIGFLNCLLSQPDDVKDRINLRLELITLKFSELYDELKKVQDSDLIIQLDLYETYQREDEAEAFEKNGFDINDPKEVFNSICFKNKDSKIKNQKFLELLQILYQLNDDESSAPESKNKFVNSINFLIASLRDISLRGNIISIRSDKSTQTSNKFDSNLYDKVSTATVHLKPPQYPPPPTPEATPTAPPRKNVVFRNKINSQINPEQINEISLIPPPPPLPVLNTSTETKAFEKLPNATQPPPPPPIGLLNLSHSSTPPPPPPIGNLNFAKMPPPPPPLGNLNSSSISIPTPPPPPPPPMNSMNLSNLPPPPPSLINKAIDKLESSIQNGSKTVYSTLPKANKPLKNFTWQKVPPTALSSNNLWKDVNDKDENVMLNFTILEELFAKTNQLIKKNNLETDQKKTDSKLMIKGISVLPQQEQLVTFLDSKQNMNVSVYLRKIKVPLNEFIQLILDGKSSEIGLDNLTCLKKILPEKSDVEAIQSFCETDPKNIDQLGRAEKFLKLLTDVPLYELRINLMNYIEEFDELYSLLLNPLEIYCKISKAILESISLKSFIRLVLAAGNYLNMNSYNGQAVGFKISILPKLIDVKTNKPSVSFLHVIVEEYDKHGHLNDNFLVDLKEISLINSNNIPTLSGNFKQLKKRNNDLLNELRQDTTPNEIKAQFIEKLENYDQKVNILQNLFEQIEAYKTKIVEYYCEDPLTFNLDEFLNIFREFCNHINTAREDIKARLINEEKILKRKKELDEIEKRRSDRLSKNFDTISKDDDQDNIVTNLLSNLKKGNMSGCRKSVKFSGLKLTTPSQDENQNAFRANLRSNLRSNQSNPLRFEFQREQ
ncbi:unnamed protein product [Brachionus calyciflorus]|uniref:Uncharacterized protein n=1 Tax=Brachionus calyciflorus TaxID=104777 RepID=A0A813QJ17_9BILA|nr:unnamed protein product [Brachionus calyciflorus]